MSYLCLGTSSEPNDTQTAAWRVSYFCKAAKTGFPERFCSRTTRDAALGWQKAVQVRATSGAATQMTKFVALTASMAAKAALAFLLLATAAAYSSQRVPIDAQRSQVVAAERRRRFNAAAALIGAATVAPSTARAITWKVRAASLHSTSRGDGVEVDLIR